MQSINAKPQVRAQPVQFWDIPATHQTDQVATPTPSTTTKPTSTSTTAHAATSTSVGSNYPVTGTIQNTRRLGCFSDSFTSRMLTGATYRQNDNTPDRCWTFCASKGYLVAGVQSGTYVRPLSLFVSVYSTRGCERE